jgi:hypothetical protein
MPNIYTPDRWVLVDLITPKETIRKVFAGWYGGFAGSDSWKLSSEVVMVTEDDNYYHFLNHTGSIYHCHKNANGMSGYMASIFAGWKSQEGDDIKIELVDVSK